MQFKNNLIFQKHIKRFYLYEIVKVVKFIETGKRTVVISGLEMGRDGELLSNGFRVSILQNESVLKMDCGAGCTTM